MDAYIYIQERKSELVKMHATERKNVALMIIEVNRVTGERSNDDVSGGGKVRVEEKE